MSEDRGDYMCYQEGDVSVIKLQCRTCKSRLDEHIDRRCKVYAQIPKGVSYMTKKCDYYDKE